MSRMRWFSRAKLIRGSGSHGAMAALLSGGNATKSHRLVWTLFPGDDHQRDFLYRRGEDDSYLILSTRHPEDTTGLWQIDSKPWQPEFESGDRLIFSLHANATVSEPAPSVESGRRARGKPHGLDQRSRATGMPFRELSEQWLASRLDGAGLETAHFSARLLPEMSIRGSKGGKTLITPVTFDGVLSVQYPDKFLARIESGFGRSRAFGLGLMLLRRA